MHDALLLESDCQAICNEKHAIQSKCHYISAAHRRVGREADVQIAPRQQGQRLRLLLLLLILPARGGKHAEYAREDIF